MFGIGPMELVLILVVALLVLGPKRMPELARTLGRGLNEFRRASNDLRQSLALDDLQNDLRAGMSGAGSIRKPGDETDRPAQAGDDLPPGQGEDDASASGETNEQAAVSTPHPGELPLDADPHAHHDDAEPEKTAQEKAAREGEEAGAGASSASATPKDSDTSGPSDANAGPPEAKAKTAAARAADSPLGNVPVGGAGPTDDRRG